MKVSLLTSSWQAATHAARGGAATLAIAVLFTNIVKNRGSLAHLLLLRWRLAFASLRAALPSRTLVAAAVFAAVYRFVHRCEAFIKLRRAQCERVVAAPPPTYSGSVGGSSRAPRASVPASVVAAVASLLCIDPASRPAILTVLTAKTASLALQDHMRRHPEHTAFAGLEVLAFMASGGWIMYSAFFASASYDPAHFKAIMWYTLVNPPRVKLIQDQYRAGLNPRLCTLRHPGRGCTEYLFPAFAARAVATAARVFVPIHLAAWLWSRCHAPAREALRSEQLATLGTNLSRSVAYFLGFIGVAMSATCYASAIGDRSLAWRKLQFALCGSVPGLAILFEPPARRRPIVVMVGSYALLSACRVATSAGPLRTLRAGPARSLLQAALFAGAVSYTLPELLRTNSLLQRLLHGGGDHRSSRQRCAHEE
ncbi:hypothetical protein PybrP1_003046 [[Pythium] brassicae (nom. inval.)]|nr:hypothetical protein PybrP1_003046 [[Pythium] brassicae (nom. inval.)]